MCLCDLHVCVKPYTRMNSIVPLYFLPDSLFLSISFVLPPLPWLKFSSFINNFCPFFSFCVYIFFFSTFLNLSLSCTFLIKWDLGNYAYLLSFKELVQKIEMPWLQLIQIKRKVTRMDKQMNKTEIKQKYNHKRFNLWANSFIARVDIKTNKISCQLEHLENMFSINISSLGIWNLDSIIFLMIYINCCRFVHKCNS